MRVEEEKGGMSLNGAVTEEGMVRGGEKVTRFFVCEMNPLTACSNVRAQPLIQPGEERTCKRAK